MITEEFESDLRATFARTAADVAVPEAARARLLAHDYRLRGGRPRLVLTAGTGLATASALAAGLIIAAGPAGTSAPSAVSFDAYTFTMPSGFHQVHASERCRPGIAFAWPLSRPGHWEKVVLPKVPKYGKAMMLAASAAGGCLGVGLAPSYRPTAATPDPELVGKTRPVKLGPFHGRYIRFRQMYEHFPHGVVIDREAIRQVFVELPVGHGRYRDLIVGGARLSKHQLIMIVVAGLKRR